MPKANELKDLEAYILGLVGEKEPCSPYFIHRTFLQSPSQFFSGSAGAIYPAVKRLEDKGFLKSTRSGSEGKPSKSLKLTAKGKAEYLKWFFNEARAGDGGFDPLRGRISMLGNIPEEDQGRALKKLAEIARGRLAYLDGVVMNKYEGQGMPRAVEMERETLKVKIKLLKKWQNQV